MGVILSNLHVFNEKKYNKLTLYSIIDDIINERIFNKDEVYSNLESVSLFISIFFNLSNWVYDFEKYTKKNITTGVKKYDIAVDLIINNFYKFYKVGEYNNNKMKDELKQVLYSYFLEVTNQIENQAHVEEATVFFNQNYQKLLDITKEMYNISEIVNKSNISNVRDRVLKIVEDFKNAAQNDILNNSVILVDLYRNLTTDNKSIENMTSEIEEEASATAEIDICEEMSNTGNIRNHNNNNNNNNTNTDANMEMFN